MEDLAGQINALLQDPESMEMLSGLAASLMGGESEEKADAHSDAAPPAPPPQSAALPLLSELGAPQLGLLMKLGRLLNSNREDDRTRLLMALRPLLSPDRQGRVDKAVKLIKIAQLLPLLRESGLELF